MKKNEVAFLAAVLGFAAVFAAMSLSHARRAQATAAVAFRSHLPAAGRPRDLDVGNVRSLIRQGRLSGQEAEFYRKVPVLPQEEDKGEGAVRTAPGSPPGTDKKDGRDTAPRPAR